MTKFITGVLSGACAALLTVGAQAAAPQTTKAEYEAAKQHAEETYKVDREKCNSLAEHAKDVCVAEAKAHRMRGEASAKAAYKNTPSAWYDQQVENADADYLVAKEKCNALTGNEKDVCVTQAKAARTKAIADAKAQRKGAEAQGDANKETTDARRDAAEDKRDADYKVELQRCDSMSGDAKDACVARAKRIFGKT
jgi:hypothetical protein